MERGLLRKVLVKLVVASKRLPFSVSHGEHGQWEIAADGV